MAADGVQLLFQPLLQHVGQRAAVVARRMLPRVVAQLLLRARDAGRVGALGDGAQVVVDGSGDLVGVRHHNFIRLFLRQIAEILQHIGRGAEVERGLVVRVLEAVAGLQNSAVDPVLRLLKVGVARGDNRLMQVLAQLYDGAVEVFDGLDRVHLPVAHHEFIVAERLHLEIIVIIGNAEQLFVGLTGHDCPVKLTCFTGRGEQQALAVLVQQAARHARFLKEILRVGSADNAVEVL